MSPKYLSKPRNLYNSTQQLPAHRVVTNNSHPAYEHNSHYRAFASFTRTLKI